jgi:hypothetical protein
MAAMSFVRGTTAKGVPILPFVAGLLTLAPLVILSGCFGLIWQLELDAGPKRLALENTRASRLIT